MSVIDERICVQLNAWWHVAMLAGLSSTKMSASSYRTRRGKSDLYLLKHLISRSQFANLFVSYNAQDFLVLPLSVLFCTYNY